MTRRANGISCESRGLTLDRKSQFYDGRPPTGRTAGVHSVSKHPSPRADQLRAMREAQFARYEQMKKEAEKAAAPAKPLAAAKPATADAPEKPPAKSAAKKSAKPAKEPKPAKAKAKKSKAKKKSGR
jgi:hypothetical protein